MMVVYCLTKILTFPGALTKGLFEHIMCKVFKSPVEKVGYLSLDETCGHVDHELIENPMASFWYCLVPGMLNWLLGVLLAVFPLSAIVCLGNYSGFLASFGISLSNAGLGRTLDFILPWFFCWLSFSMFCNLAPLYEDALKLKENYDKLGKGARIAFALAYMNIRVGAFLEKYGLTFVLFAVLTFLLSIVRF